MTTQDTIRLEPSTRRIRVTFGGETIADSKDAIILHERGRPPVYYFPESDVRLELLSPTEQSSFCPFKGSASYWTLKVGDHIAENAAWSYRDPIELSQGIKGYISFYTNIVETVLEDE